MLPFLSSSLPSLSLLLFDLRDHGASDADGKGLTMGVREHADVMAACCFAKETLGFKGVVLFGTSVGASSCLLACARMVRCYPRGHCVMWVMWRLYVCVALFRGLPGPSSLCLCVSMPVSHCVCVVCV